MLLLLLLPGLFACRPSDGETDGTPASIDTTGMTARHACDDLRFEIANAELNVAFAVDLDVTAAAYAGTATEITVTLPDAARRAAAVAERAGGTDGEVCSSSEEFPPMDAPGWWDGTAGTITARFEPHQAWPDDGTWTYDGTEIGTATLTIEGLVLEPRGDETETLDLGDGSWSVALANPELPA